MAVAAAAMTLVACGGSGPRQDAGDHPATYRVEVVEAAFPARQQLGRQTEMRIAVRNLDDRTIPNVAATVSAAGAGTAIAAFGRSVDRPDVSSQSRPVWILDAGPPGGETVYSNTWALGALPPGRTRTFVWKVTPVVAGPHRLTYRLAGSLPGNARLELPGGGVPAGRFAPEIVSAPGATRVTPGGKIVRVPAGRDAAAE